MATRKKPKKLHEKLNGMTHELNMVLEDLSEAIDRLQMLIDEVEELETCGNVD